MSEISARVEFFPAPGREDEYREVGFAVREVKPAAPDPAAAMRRAELSGQLAGAKSVLADVRSQLALATAEGAAPRELKTLRRQVGECESEVKGLADALAALDRG